MNPIADDEHSFIVRIWQEAQGASPIWRGSIRYVATNEQMYFQSPDKLIAFIVAKTGASGWQPDEQAGFSRSLRSLLDCLGRRRQGSHR